MCYVTTPIRLAICIVFLGCSLAATPSQLPLSPPLAPQSLQVTPAGADTWVLRWEDLSADESGFIIEEDNGGWTQVASVGPNSTVYLADGSTSGASNAYRVRAWNGAGSSAWTSPVSGAAADPMNIIFLLADDMGYKDIVALRDESTDGPSIHETPALDTLVDQSVTFTNAFASGPRCVVARRALQTGMYDFRPEAIGSGGGIDPSETTIGEALKAAGYRTCFIGKWHLGSQADGKAPEHQGYDVSIAAGEYGAPNNSYFPDPGTLSYNLPNLGPAASADEYLTDRLTTEGRGFIADHVANHPGQPFFMILSHYAVHTPLEAKPEDISYFTDKKAATDFSTHPIATPIITDYTADVRVWQSNEVYAAMMRSYDESLAGLRQELEDQGIADQTIIVVSSDHGGKSTFDEDKNTAEADFPTSNYPFRLGKTWCYDGGLRIPLIVYWPGVTEAGIQTEAFVHGADFYKTFLDMAGAAPIPSQHVDSVSFLPAAIDGSNGDRPDSLHYFYGLSDGTGSTALGALRKGRYKLLYHLHRRFAELYDIATDPGEQVDLFDTFPTLAADLLDEFLRQRKATDAKLLDPGQNNWNTEVSNLQSYMTIPSAPASAPGAVTVTPVARSVIDLSWTDNSTNETRFIVFRKGPGESSYDEVKVLPANTTSWRDSGLETASSYSYYIVAHNMGGWKTSSTVSASTLGAGAPMPVNAKDDTVRIRASETRSIHALLNDEGEGLVIDSVGSSTLGTASVVDNRIQYTPIPGKTGSEVVTYTIRDEGSNTDTASLLITVEPEPGTGDWSAYGLLPGTVGGAPGGSVLDRFDGIMEWSLNGGQLADGASDSIPLQAQYRESDYSFSILISRVHGPGEAGINIREATSPLARSLTVAMATDGTVTVRNRDLTGSTTLSDDLEWSGILPGEEAVLTVERRGEGLTVSASNDNHNSIQLAQVTWPGTAGHFVGLTGFSPASDGHFSFSDPRFLAGLGFTADLLSLPQATSGSAYSLDLTGYLNGGGTAPFTFSTAIAPAWLSLSPSGLLSGTPGDINAGPTTFSVTVTDVEGAMATVSVDLPVVKAGGSGGTTDVPVSEDSFTKSNDTASNNGSRDPVQVRDPASSFGRYSFFKYTVSGTSGTPSQVELHFYVTAYTGTAFRVYSVPDNSWTEGTITWDNQPDPATYSLIGSYPVTAGEWLVVDVTSLVTGDGTYSFAVTEFDNTRGDIAAKGNAFQSFLRLNYGPVNVAPVQDSAVPVITAKSNLEMLKNIGSHFSDPDGDALIFTKLTGPAWLDVSSDGTLLGTPSPDDAGSTTLELLVADVYGESIEVTIDVSVSLSQLDAWLAGSGLSGLAGLPQSDADNDGRTNLLEFWEDTNPDLPESGGYTTVLESVAPGSPWAVEFGHQTRDTDRISARFYWSDDLTNWTEVLSSGTSSSPLVGDLEWSTESFQIFTSDRLFLRRVLSLQ